VEEETGEWIEVHNEEFHNLHSTLCTVGMTNMKARYVGLATRVRGNKKMLLIFTWGNLKERDHLQGLNVDGRIMLK